MSSLFKTKAEFASFHETLSFLLGRAYTVISIMSEVKNDDNK